VGAERVPPETLGYFQARNKHNAYDLVMKEFEESGLSQADLARRLGKAPEVICRLLGGPGNWTLDTLSDLMFAISGAVPVYGKAYPLGEPPRNQMGPIWLYDGDEDSERISDTAKTADYPSIQKPEFEAA
jgi:hypothetical protein